MRLRWEITETYELSTWAVVVLFVCLFVFKSVNRDHIFSVSASSQRPWSSFMYTWYYVLASLWVDVAMLLVRTFPHRLWHLTTWSPVDGPVWRI